MKYLKDYAPQLWSIKPAIILNSFGVNSWKPVIRRNFLQRKGDFNYRNAIFLLLPPENEFLQKFWTIRLITMKNSQSSHDKFYVKFVKAFSGLFCINITWHHVNLNIKCFFLMIPPPRPCDIFKISEKPSLNLKPFFNQKIEAETFRNLQNHKKSLNSTLVPRPPN